MTNEQEIFALMQMAKDQQVAVERALAGLASRNSELETTVAKMQGLQGKVAEEAQKGAEAGLRGMSSRAINALDAEVEKAKRLIGEGAQTLRRRESSNLFIWTVMGLLLGVVLGLTLSWYTWGRDTRAAVDRLDEIIQANTHKVQEQDQKKAVQKPAQTGHSVTSRKPKSALQAQEPQERP